VLFLYEVHFLTVLGMAKSWEPFEIVFS
jgi:hypothetical protein